MSCVVASICGSSRRKRRSLPKRPRSANSIRHLPRKPSLLQARKQSVRQSNPQPWATSFLMGCLRKHMPPSRISWRHRVRPRSGIISGKVIEVFDMRTSTIGIHRRLAGCAQLMGLVGLLLSSPAVADIYPIKGVWVAPNPDFPIGPDEACFTVRLSGIEAVARKLIAELLIFNENKRYEVKQNIQTVSTLVSAKPAEGGYWVTEFSDVRRRFWFRQKITYLLTIIDPTTIEIRNNSHRTRIREMRPTRQVARLSEGQQHW